MCGTIEEGIGDLNEIFAGFIDGRKVVKSKSGPILTK
jgi:hypothetical protein